MCKKSKNLSAQDVLDNDDLLLTDEQTARLKKSNIINGACSLVFVTFTVVNCVLQLLKEFAGFEMSKGASIALAVVMLVVMLTALILYFVNMSQMKKLAKEIESNQPTEQSEQEQPKEDNL